MSNQRFLQPLSPEQLLRLHQAELAARHLYQRNRIRAVLLSGQNHWEVDQIAAALDICSHTVYRALDRFDQGGVEHLADAPRRGRPPKVSLWRPAAPA